MVCRQLGFLENVKHLIVHGAFFGRGESAIHLDDLSCVGNETRLSDCSRKPVGIHNCVHSEDAGVVCTGKK